MAQEVFTVKKERFHLINKNQYILQGSWPKGFTPEAYLDERKISVEAESWANNSMIENRQNIDEVQGVTFSVHLPDAYKKYKRLQIYAVREQERKLWFSIGTGAVAKKQNAPQFFIDEERVRYEEKKIQIRGWAVGDGNVSVKFLDGKLRPVQAEIQWGNRPDVVAMYPEKQVELKSGFFAELPLGSGAYCWIQIEDEAGRVRRRIPVGRAAVLMRRTKRCCRKGIRYLKLHGFKATVQKTLGKVEEVRRGPVEYGKWRLDHLPSAAELARQRKESFSWEPKISIVVPLYRTPQGYLEKLVASVKEQTYGNWQLCLSDGSGADSPLRAYLEKLERSDDRIRVVFHKETLKIAENTNEAIRISDGEFIGFADHDDELTPWALYECVKALNRHTKCEMLYSDEDKMSMDGNKFFQPNFKPDYSPDFLCSVNYICHFLVVKRTLAERVGLLDHAFDGAQDYDFILRCTEQTDQIVHVPKVLYHWRCHENSTSENPESKEYAFEAGRRAVQAHYERIGIRAEVKNGEFPGLYRTVFIRERDPLISIIIPNKDHIDDLKRCLDSIDETSSYRNYEYIIIENNSTEKETFVYYEQLQAEKKNVKVVYYKGNFNYSAINNFGVQYARGEYLLLLNNDTQIINPECLEEMLGYCMKPDVGAVGARLYYEDDTIQHAGVVVGFGGIAGHCFVQQPRSYTGYCHRIICAQNYSAVTAACMMVKRSVFEQVGGLTEELQVAFNDIDFCMKVRAAGYLIVYNPYAELYHYESKSRGLEDTPEKMERFRREIAVFERRWPEILRDGDPYYNPNLTLESQDFSLKRS